MKSLQYLPMELTLLKDERVVRMIETHGVKSFGAYMILLCELPNHRGCRCRLSSIQAVRRAYKLGTKMIESILNDFGLFERNVEENVEFISSPYVDRVVTEIERKNNLCSEAGKRGAMIRYGKKDRVPHSDPIATNITTTFSTHKESNSEIINIPSLSVNNQNTKSWEDFVTDAASERSWLEQLAMKSHFGRHFVDRPKAMINFFLQHVKLQGKEFEICSVPEAKNYMANFYRPGTKTWKEVRKLLEQLIEEERKKAGISPYEDYDPKTGERSYYGIPIPADAPPRPDDRMCWNPTENVWD